MSAQDRMCQRYDFGPVQILHDEQGRVWTRHLSDPARARLVGIVRSGEAPLRVRGVSVPVVPRDDKEAKG